MFGSYVIGGSRPARVPPSSSCKLLRKNLPTQSNYACFHHKPYYTKLVTCTNLAIINQSSISIFSLVKQSETTIFQWLTWLNSHHSAGAPNHQGKDSRADHLRRAISTWAQRILTGCRFGNGKTAGCWCTKKKVQIWMFHMVL